MIEYATARSLKPGMPSSNTRAAAPAHRGLRCAARLPLQVVSSDAFSKEKLRRWKPSARI